MRRMYSKEQLQKLIDEVSRLIAIEELDKVVPVPALADAGKVITVNATGTGYELKSADTKDLYFHPLTIYNDSPYSEIGGKTYKLQMSAEILSDSGTALNSGTKLKNFIVGKFTRLNVAGSIVNTTDEKCIIVIQLLFTADGNHIYVIGSEPDGTQHTEVANQIDLINNLSEINVIDAVNQIL